MTLDERIKNIEELFNKMHNQQASTWQIGLVAQFRKEYPELNEDLDFCFEVLAGKHKVGYTYVTNSNSKANIEYYEDITIKEFYETFLKRANTTEYEILQATRSTPSEWQSFFGGLVNRGYRLGYSNKHSMISELSPMLAKKYPDDHREQFYYIQEKLDGNRCIAYFEDGQWKFRSRSGKPLKVNFDMSWADINHTFDGEIMTLGKAGSRDFNRTSGAINSKYGDKSDLHYYIYDIIDNTLKYEDRKSILDSYQEEGTKKDCSILPILDKIWVYPNLQWNYLLDEWLDKIVDKGGEGIMLRDPDAVYQNGKRSNALLKYKKVKTMDLRVIGINEGTGKYEGMIGSLLCIDDNQTIMVNVGSGLTDDMRELPDDFFLDQIVEVAYFDICESDKKEYKSLRFPRLIKVCDDKSETSVY